MPIGRPFGKGVSGNPSGMGRAAADVVQAAREHTVAAVARLVALMQQDDDRDVALAAANALLDRGWGRPPQAILAQVHASALQSGIDKPPEITESYEEWLARRRAELDTLELASGAAK